MDKKRKIFPLSSFSIAILICMVVLVVTIGLLGNQRRNNSTDGIKRITLSKKAVQDICRGVDFTDACNQNLPFKLFNFDHTPQDMLKLGFQAAINNLRSAAQTVISLQMQNADQHTKNALKACSKLADMAANDLQRSMQHAINHDVNSLQDILDDLLTWLSGSLTYQKTCLDSFLHTNGSVPAGPVGPIHDNVKRALSKGMELTINALGMAAQICNPTGGSPDGTPSGSPGGSTGAATKDQSKGDGSKGNGSKDDSKDGSKGNGSKDDSKDGSKGDGSKDDSKGDRSKGDSKDAKNNAHSRRLKSLLRFPEGLDSIRRALLDGGPPPSVKPDVIVAQDGSGKYKTINESLKDIPLNGDKLFVLYIKAGIYNEQITFNIAMTHLMVIGDGPTKTKITGAQNVMDGATTYLSATVAVEGDFFIAKDIGFENTAGPAKGQAVALRVGADKVIFSNCIVDGNQDSLYTHTYRQFYRDCTILGTIDFLFGDSAAVFQNCNLLIKKPALGQQGVIMAQSRLNVRQPTGIVLQNCTIVEDASLRPDKATVEVYLGRPWAENSRTIVMESFIGDVIRPDGYTLWNGTFGIDTLFYSEFNNRGPGSPKDKRVKWKGIRELPPDQIQRFTAKDFIQGDTWVPPTKIPYAGGFMFPEKTTPGAKGPAAGNDDVPFQNNKNCFLSTANFGSNTCV